MDTVSVIIATFGEFSHWDSLANRALMSVKSQTVQPDEIIRCHSSTLQKARNNGAAQATSDWLLFLDADDTLDKNYVASMLSGEGDLRYPSIVRVFSDHETGPVLLPSSPLLRHNYMVIGTLIRRVQFQKIGGFDDWPIYEDWALWIKAWIDGARSRPCPDAVYRVSVREGSRNNQVELQKPIRDAIVRKYMPEARKKKLPI